MSAVLGQQLCRKCGTTTEGRSVRFICPTCGTENRPNRSSMSERAHTQSRRQLEREHRHLRIVREDDITEQRPRTRAECKDAPRPCPWVSCRHHLALEVSAAGGIKIKFPELELEDMPHTCSLDVADQGPQSGATVGFVMNVTNARVEQIEKSALDSFRRSLVFTEDDI